MSINIWSKIHKISGTDYTARVYEFVEFPHVTITDKEYNEVQMKVANEWSKRGNTGDLHQMIYDRLLTEYVYSSVPSDPFVEGFDEAFG